MQKYYDDILLKLEGRIQELEIEIDSPIQRIEIIIVLTHIASSFT